MILTCPECGTKYVVKDDAIPEGGRDVQCSNCGTAWFQLPPEIEAELEALTELRDKPAGTVRITCGDHVLHSVLLPRLTPLLREFPDIKLEFDMNYGFRDIVADRFDAGVRMGNTIDKDMIAVPIGPPLQMAVVASPDYIARHGVPLTPRDLLDFNCLVYDRPKGGDWRFKGRDGEQSIKVSGNLRSNVAEGLIDAAIAGLGVAALPSFAIAPHLASGQLVALLTDYQLPESTLYAVFLPEMPYMRYTEKRYIYSYGYV